MFIICIIPFALSSIEANDKNGQAEFKKTILMLSLDDGKLMVLEKNLDITAQRIAPQIEEAKIDKERGTFDPLFSGSLRRLDSTRPLTTRSSVAAGGRTIVNSDVHSIHTGISGKVPLGTEYSIEFEDIWTENTFNEFRAEYDAFAGIKVTQPLLKDFGYDTNRFNILIAQKNKDISDSELKDRVIDTIAGFKNAYWDMVLAIENLRVSEESLKLAESLLDLNRKRLKAEVISPLEVTQAEAGVASRKEDVIIARKDIKEKENALKRLISDDIYAMKDVDILPSDVPGFMPVALNLDESVRSGLANRPDYQKMKLEMKKNDITIQYAENQKFPNIDLEASYGLNGLADSFGDSLNDLDNNTEWALGVVVKFPIGNRAAKGDIMVARLEAKKALLSLKNLEQQILVEIDDAIRELDTNKQRIEATRISTRLEEESLNAEELKLKAGLSTSHDVLQFQEDLAEAKSREISAIIDYNKSKVELSRVKGVLLEEEGIHFSEYIAMRSGR
jgi:outer membrane protein TolC